MVWFVGVWIEWAEKLLEQWELQKLLLIAQKQIVINSFFCFHYLMIQ